MNYAAADSPSMERALIVDDLRVNRATLRALLKHESDAIVVDEAYDVPSALRQITSNSYDVVLLDLNLRASGDGLAVLRALRSTDHEAATPVILVSSREPDDTFIANALREGADDYVSRPVDARLLAARVANARRARRRFRLAQRNAEVAVSRADEIDDERKAAGAAQRGMLARMPVSFGSASVSAAMVPFGAVSGDAYDAVVSPSGLVSVVLVDVTGHGAGAGMVASSTIAALRQSLRAEMPLSYLFNVVESRVLDSNEHCPPVAMSIARYNPRSSQLEFANAGMPSALLVDHRGERTALSSTAPSVGMIRGRLPQRTVLSVDERSVLLMASDGLSGPLGTSAACDELWLRIQSYESAEALAAADSALVAALVREQLWSFGVSPNDDATLVAAAFRRTYSREKR